MEYRQFRQTDLRVSTIGFSINCSVTEPTGWLEDDQPAAAR
ncbi:MAG TPA: hypothetical protein VMS64_38655 [Candidatus Methylomirabilis sp.]|nr:hypothetical protein [Candidatus Methylomirabilis sp.]